MVHEDQDRRRFALLLTLVHLALLALLLASHDPWRDEMQAWVLARDSASLAELSANLRYEGHPILWYLLLYPLTRLTTDPAAMQVLHAVIVAAVVYVVARWAPFSRLVRALLVFGYFFIFEYALLSRGYALGLLLLFTACVLFPRRRESYLIVAVPLALLANTSAYGVIAAFAFGGALLADWLTDAETRRASMARAGRTGAAVLLLLTAGIAGAYQVRPPPSAPFQGEPIEREETVSPYAIATTGALVWAAYVPIAQGGSKPIWGANLLFTGQRPPLALALALSLLLSGAFVLILFRTPAGLVLYVVGTATIMVMAYTVFVGYTRHHGHLWPLALAALWLALGGAPRWRVPRWLERLGSQAERRYQWVLVPILLAQIAAAAQHLQAIQRTGFSSVKAATEVAERERRPGEIVAVVPDYVGVVASAVLERPVYLAELRHFGSFMPWGLLHERRRAPRGREHELLRPLLAEQPSVLLIISGPLAPRLDDLVAEELAAFPEAFEPYERAWVYRVTRAP